MDDPRRRQGQQAEDAAVRALTAAGITVLAQLALPGGRDRHRRRGCRPRLRIGSS
ncbi:MAG: hypothetical protein R2873_16570 [Caldilineaceae bacterium]